MGSIWGRVSTTDWLAGRQLHPIDSRVPTAKRPDDFATLTNLGSDCKKN
jgi:hypothetical protein